MNDTCTSSRLNAAKSRAKMLANARRFFGERDVMEISTPVLSRAAVSDPQIESICARLDVDSAASYFLRTSPEFCMKRLLCEGFPDLYEIGTVFRDGESGRRHQPEFTMVEWYRLDFGLMEIIDDTIAFIRTAVPGNRLSQAVFKTSYRDAFLEFAGIDPMSSDIDCLIEVSGADDRLQTVLGGNRDDYLNLILANRVVAAFPRDRLTVLYHYPASQAALSRICPHDDAVADRFEIFHAELELANGYVELNDADEQRRRCDADQELRRAAGVAVRPLDQEFLAALDHGLPPCAGVAVGFDRLVMLHEQTNDIRDVVTFAYRR
jgi:lysyl-tRNA synthetase class 2